MGLMSPGPEIPSLPAWYYFPLPVGSLPFCTFPEMGITVTGKRIFITLFRRWRKEKLADPEVCITRIQY
jgi:hypothetical protein